MSRMERDIEALPTREKTNRSRQSWNSQYDHTRKVQPQWKKERHVSFRRERISEHLMEAA